MAIRTHSDGKTERLVRFVKGFDEYLDFVKKYRYEFDIFNQIATNRGTQDGTLDKQWRRKVLFLDFDQKDYPNMKSAQDCT